MLALQMLGTPSLQRDGRAVPLPARKLLALLMLLALSTEPLPRTRVVALLWPLLDEPNGRRNLRRELARLRESDAGEAVRVDGDTLALGEPVPCDAVAFARALLAGRHDAALALWRGAPAEGFVLGDADAFDDWLAQQRVHFVERRRQALHASAAAREAAGDVAGALERIEALLADDPLQEQAHRDAMRLLAAAGRREAALAQYERCRAVLRAELGLAPMAETEALAASLRGVASDPPRREPAAAAPPSAAGAGRRAARLPEQLPFVGRNAEVAQLEVAWRARRPIVIEGEGGVGKTRLALDFAAAHGPYALARCRAGDAGLPYASFTRALRALMGPTPALPALPDWVERELTRLIPELGAPPPPIHSDEERNRFFEACARGWHALAADDFDAVVLDDWHFADAASRALLAFIAGRRSEGEVAGTREVLLLRPELDAAAGDALRALVGATGALHLQLQGLAGDAVLELVRQLSGASHPVRFAGRLDRATRGNPFFLVETLRHLVETELISTDAVGGWQTPFDDATDDYRELPVPASVLETVLARVQRLAVPSRRVLEAAALASEPFAPSLLAPACALSEFDTVLAIEEAVAARLLREHEAGGFAFAHDLVQQALSGSLSDERRRLVHRRLALGAEAARAPAATIATHHEASGEAWRAVDHRIAAGDEARRLRALSDALAQWTLALADGPTPSQALRLHERLIKVGHERSDFDTVRRQADALAGLLAGTALTAAERVDASICRGLALARGERAAEALEVLDAMPGLPTGRQRFDAWWTRALALNKLGRSDDTEAALSAAMALPDLGDVDRMELLDFAFMTAFNTGRNDVALVHTDAALAIAHRVGDLPGLARSHFRRGVLLLVLHDTSGAEAALLAAAHDAGHLGLVNLQRVALYNLNCVYSSQSLPLQALETVQRGWDLSPPMQSSSLRVMYRLAMVDAHHALGDLGHCWQHAEPAVHEALADDDPHARISAAMCTLEPLGLLGEVALARRLVASIGVEALRGLKALADEMWVALAQFELKQGRPADAAAALAELDASGEPVVARVGVRLAQARAELALAGGDASAAIALLPQDDVPGMNGEMRLRGLALRVAAEAHHGRLAEATVEVAQAALDEPSVHETATLELLSALSRAATAGVAGAPAMSVTRYAARVAARAKTLDEHPAQRAAFVRAWA